ncbi:MAG TPA: hypothetical protein VGV90_08310 [Solirubrobacteraceae bacterium]|nr:hypothetical protein [Solirubrobacteraceae bacterium]
MRRRWIFPSALLASAGLAVAPSGGASAQGDRVTKLDCTLALNAQGAPNPSGIHLGFARCPKPFGRGLHHNSYTVTPSGPGQGSVAATFKNYYNLGTVRGRAEMTFAATSPMNITYKGTLTYTGGTGRFRHVRGSGTIECTTTDGGAHKACTVKSRLRGL